MGVRILSKRAQQVRVDSRCRGVIGTCRLQVLGCGRHIAGMERGATFTVRTVQRIGGHGHQARGARLVGCRLKQGLQGMGTPQELLERGNSRVPHLPCAGLARHPPCPGLQQLQRGLHAPQGIQAPEQRAEAARGSRRHGHVFRALGKALQCPHRSLLVRLRRRLDGGEMHGMRDLDARSGQEGLQCGPCSGTVFKATQATDGDGTKRVGSSALGDSHEGFDDALARLGVVAGIMMLHQRLAPCGQFRGQALVHGLLPRIQRSVEGGRRGRRLVGNRGACGDPSQAQHECDGGKAHARTRGPPGRRR